MTYTDDDVQRLVEVTSNLSNWLNLGKDIHPGLSMHKQLAESLKPFQSDKEEELVEAMKEAGDKAYNDYMRTHRGDGSNYEAGIVAVRAALEVVKERGLPQ